MSLASRCWLMPIGSRNPSRRISPRRIGGSLPSLPHVACQDGLGSAQLPGISTLALDVANGLVFRQGQDQAGQRPIGNCGQAENVL